MPRVLAFLLAGLLLLVAGPAEADAVGSAVARLDALARARASVAAERLKLSAAYGAQTREIAALKARPSSWARDRQLQTLLRSAKDAAAGLDARERELARRDADLAAARRAALQAIDAELAAAAEPRRGTLVSLRARIAGPAPARPIRIPDGSIDPLDDPEDLEQKAGALADAEVRLLRERDRLARRAQVYQRQALLARAKQRAEAPDLLASDDPRRTPSPPVARGGSQVAEPNNDSAEGGVGAEAPPTPTTGGGNFDQGGDPAVVLADVVDPTTLAELRRAEQGGDADRRAQAADAARRSVDARLAKLRAQRLEMEKRARALRSGAP